MLKFFQVLLRTESEDPENPGIHQAFNRETGFLFKCHYGNVFVAAPCVQAVYEVFGEELIKAVEVVDNPPFYLILPNIGGGGDNDKPYMNSPDPDTPKKKRITPRMPVTSLN